jgi:hypothetical protein
MRAIRTADHLYIHNHRPERWPMGSPYYSSSQGIFSDADDGPTKNWLIEHANAPSIKPMFRQLFGKRQEHELYVLSEDPHQTNNVAGQAKYEPIQQHLHQTLQSELRALDDPRATDAKVKFDDYPYHTGYGKQRVQPPESVKKALDLDQDN